MLENFNLFDNATPIQVFNTIINIVSIFGFIIVLSVVWGYKRRVKERYEEINKHLENILLLTHEVYQSDKDLKQKVIVLDPKDLAPIPGKTIQERISGSKL